MLFPRTVALTLGTFPFFTTVNKAKGKIMMKYDYNINYYEKPLFILFLTWG